MAANKSYSKELQEICLEELCCDESVQRMKQVKFRLTDIHEHRMWLPLQLDKKQSHTQKSHQEWWHPEI